VQEVTPIIRRAEKKEFGVYGLATKKEKSF
jgi:hypothetical protein